jgi:RNA polymerase sigma-70 factor (ECF subfamily)
MKVASEAGANIADEASLVRAVARGDERAAEALYYAYREPLTRFICARVDERIEDAEELAVDTILSAIEMAPTYAPRNTVRSWLFGIAKLRIVDYYRKLGSEKRPPRRAQVPLDEEVLQVMGAYRAGSLTEDQVLEHIEAERLLGSLMSPLNDEERDVLLMRYVDQLSVREIAALIDRTEKAAENLLTRAKNKQRELLGTLVGGVSAEHGERP